MNRVDSTAAPLPPRSPILLATHRRADLAFFRDRLLEAGVNQPVVTFDAAEALLDYLGAVCIADSTDPRFKPCLLFIDDTMAGRSAGDIIAWIRRQPALQRLRVVLLSDQEATRTERAAAHVISRFPAAATLAWLAATACGGNMA